MIKADELQIRRSDHAPSSRPSCGSGTSDSSRRARESAISTSAGRGMNATTDLVRGSRSAAEDLLRPGEDDRGRRHLRRTLARPEQRHPLGLLRARLQLPGAARARRPERLHGAQSRLGTQAGGAQSHFLENIHYLGGTVLGSSRGHQEPAVIVDTLEREQIDILFCVGGDGTQRGASAIFEEVAQARAAEGDRRHPQDDRQRHRVRLHLVRLQHRPREGRGGCSAGPTWRPAGRPTASAWSS